MLKSLRIEGVEIFKDESIPFKKGLNIISGETGAGKSVLLGCLLATLGEDPPRQLLQDGFLESTWGGKSPGSLEHLIEEDVWSLARQVRDGRASALCMGRTVSASLLKEAAEETLLRSGQHSSGELRNPAYHQDTLDRFAQIDRDALKESWSSYQGAKGELASLKLQIKEAKEKEDYLVHELELLRKGSPRLGETAELEEERESLLHLEERREALSKSAALALLAEENLAGAEDALLKIAAFDAQAASSAEVLKRLLLETQDISSQTSELLSSIDAPPGRLEEIERRLTEIQGLRRRFRGATEEELIDMLAKKETELALAEGGASDADAKEKEVSNLYKKYQSLAKRAHKERVSAAKDLESRVNKELSGLAVEADFAVLVEEGKESAEGFSEVEFLLQRGKRESRLAEAASGGELSRLSLALLLASGSDKDVFLFDEIDTGIGGETAHLLANKLSSLSKSAQVIVISHLPQIALRADHLVSLYRKDGKTEIKEANSEASRREELARLAGAHGEESGAFIEELLEKARLKETESG